MDKLKKVNCNNCEYWVDEAVPNDMGECHFWPPSNTGNPSLRSFFPRTMRTDFCFQGCLKEQEILIKEIKPIEEPIIEEIKPIEEVKPIFIKENIKPKNKIKK